MKITDDMVERGARGIILANDGGKWALREGEWKAEVARYRDLASRHPQYASGRGLITDAFRNARAALEAALNPPKTNKRDGEHG